MDALKVEKRGHGQFAIVNADIRDVETGKWEDQYVSLSGYCGPYKPSLFAAAPELLEALQGCLPRNVCLTNTNIPDNTIIPLDVTMGELRKIAAAIAKATA